MIDTCNPCIKTYVAWLVQTTNLLPQHYSQQPRLQLHIFKEMSKSHCTDRLELATDWLINGFSVSVVKHTILHEPLHDVLKLIGTSSMFMMNYVTKVNKPAKIES